MHIISYNHLLLGHRTGGGLNPHDIFFSVTEISKPPEGAISQVAHALLSWRCEPKTVTFGLRGWPDWSCWPLRFPIRTGKSPEEPGAANHLQNSGVLPVVLWDSWQQEMGQSMPSTALEVCRGVMRWGSASSFWTRALSYPVLVTRHGPGLIPGYLRYPHVWYLMFLLILSPYY